MPRWGTGGWRELFGGRKKFSMELNMEKHNFCENQAVASLFCSLPYNLYPLNHLTFGSWLER